MAVIEIPVRADLPAYEFKMELEGTLYTLKFRWNERMAIWIFTLADEQGQDLLCGMPLYSGVDLAAHFKRDELPPGLFMVYDEAGKGREADRENFGVDLKFLYEESGE